MFEVVGYISTDDKISLPFEELINIEKPNDYKSSFIIKEEPFHCVVFSQKEDIFQKNKNFYFENNDEKVFIIAHLYNRMELISLLNLNQTTTDSEILYRAYLWRGIDGLKKCFGKWMMISYSKIKKKKLIVRDHLGMFNYYYCFVNHSLVFSTNIQLLFNFKQINKEINPMYLAGLAVGFLGDGYETAFKNIFKVPPSSSIDVIEGKSNLQTYWSPIMEETIIYANKYDYYEHFNCLFNKILSESLQGAGVVASTLSSGLDSTYVTAMAAEVLNKQNKSLIAVTASPKYSNVSIKSHYRYADEIPLAELVAKKYSNITHIIDKALETSPLDGLLKSLNVHSYPVRNASNQYWLLSLFEKLKEQNVDTLLIGQMGNLTFSWPFYNHLGSLFYWRKKLKKTILFNRPFYLKNSFLNQTFIKQNNLVKYLKSKNYYPDYYSKDLNKMRSYFFKQMQTTGYASWNEKANYFGINLIDPTADVRLVEYCFSIPQNLYKNEDGSRLFIRNAAKNIVPNEILLNTKKAIQSADANKRLMDELEAKNDLLKLAFMNPLVNEMFDIELLISRMNNQKLSTHVFLRSLLIILFIYFATNKDVIRKN